MVTASIGQRWRRQGLVVEIVRYDPSWDMMIVKTVQNFVGYDIGAELRYDGYKFREHRDELCFEYLEGQDNMRMYHEDS